MTVKGLPRGRTPPVHGPPALPSPVHRRHYTLKSMTPASCPIRFNNMRTLFIPEHGYEDEQVAERRDDDDDDEDERNDCHHRQRIVERQVGLPAFSAAVIGDRWRHIGVPCWVADDRHPRSTRPTVDRARKHVSSNGESRQVRGSICRNQITARDNKYRTNYWSHAKKMKYSSIDGWCQWPI